MEDTILRLTENVGVTGGTVLFVLLYFSKKIEALTSLLRAVEYLQERHRADERRIEKLEEELERLKK